MISCPTSSTISAASIADSTSLTFPLRRTSLIRRHGRSHSNAFAWRTLINASAPPSLNRPRVRGKSLVDKLVEQIIILNQKIHQKINNVSYHEFTVLILYFSRYLIVIIWKMDLFR